jgi:parallel beta-helix repeat protein
MYNDSSSPTLANCYFLQNSAPCGDYCRGGGIYNIYSSPSLTKCFFVQNVARDGGGMFNHDDSAPVLTDCVFSANEAYVGGGMMNQYSSPILADCTFSGNTASGGGAIYEYNSPTTATNCTFEGNTAWNWGGGLFVFGHISPTLTNCTFYGNSAGISGGAVYYGSPILKNCILWGDTPDEIDATAAVTYSDIQGGYAGQGNINANPLWVDPANGDFHLAAGSPCIDAGTNDAPYLPPYDFEGDPRVMDGDGDGDAIVDMGVDEVLGPVEATMHVGGIEGLFSLDPYGRMLLRSHVLVVDQAGQPLGEVQVEASITAPCGGPHARSRLTKPGGNARFAWGCNEAGPWELCVENLARVGYLYAPGDNVVTCQAWQN